MKCHFCGSILGNNDKVCKRCGAPPQQDYQNNADSLFSLLSKVVVSKFVGEKKENETQKTDNTKSEYFPYIGPLKGWKSHRRDDKYCYKCGGDLMPMARKNGEGYYNPQNRKWTDPTVTLYSFCKNGCKFEPPDCPDSYYWERGRWRSFQAGANGLF